MAQVSLRPSACEASPAEVVVWRSPDLPDVLPIEQTRLAANNLDVGSPDTEVVDGVA